MPSSPYDAKGLLISAIRDPDPVIFFEPKRIYRAFREEVPEDEYTIPIGKAQGRRGR
jgi:pyruvate dehydrogenase E1 component beta subunit